MRTLRYILLLSLLPAAFACSGVKKSDVVNNNEFTLESADARWSDGTITFDPDGGEVTLQVVHDVTSLAWRMRCALDDAWCNYKSDADALRVIVAANPEPTSRETHFDVIIGEHTRRVNVIQRYVEAPPHETDPSDLPNTEWDNEETQW